MSPSATPRPAPREGRPLPRWLLVAWALTGVLLTIAAWISVRRAEQSRRADWESRLSALADDRLAIAERAIHEWRRDAHLLAGLESVRALFAPGGGMPPAAARARRELDELVRADPEISIGVRISSWR